MTEGWLLKTIIDALREYYPNAEKTKKIIINSALAATGANMVGAIIPGLAVPATIVGCFGIVWAMYAMLCKELGITIKENVLKLLARAVLANISSNLAALLVAELLLSFIPGASIASAAIVAFSAVYLAGVIFLKLILKLARKSSDPFAFSDISAKEMKKEVQDMKVDKDALNAAKQAYAENKDNQN